jgi:hypothetical protein
VVEENEKEIKKLAEERREMSVVLSFEFIFV